VEWAPNIVLVEKKGTKKIKICVDFRNLNKATPKDEYPMPILDALVNSASGNRMMSFLDGNMLQSDLYGRRGCVKNCFLLP
jgi:hypothetical protein